MNLTDAKAEFKKAESVTGNTVSSMLVQGMSPIIVLAGLGATLAKLLASAAECAPEDPNFVPSFVDTLMEATDGLRQGIRDEGGPEAIQKQMEARGFDLDEFSPRPAKRKLN